MAAHQIIVHTSEIQNSGEVLSLLKSSHNLQIQVKSELKVGFLISPRLGVNKVTHSDFFNEDRGQEIIEMAQTMNDYFSRPFFIIEGSKELFKEPRSSFGDSVISMLTRSNIRVLHSSGESQTSSLLSTLVKKEIEKGYTLSYPDISELSKLRKCHFQLYLNLPGVNYGLALQMVNNLVDPAELIVGDSETIFGKLMIVPKKLENIRSFCQAQAVSVRENENVDEDYYYALRPEGLDSDSEPDPDEATQLLDYRVNESTLATPKAAAAPQYPKFEELKAARESARKENDSEPDPDGETEAETDAESEPEIDSESETEIQAQVSRTEAPTKKSVKSRVVSTSPLLAPVKKSKKRFKMSKNRSSLGMAKLIETNDIFDNQTFDQRCILENDILYETLLYDDHIKRFLREKSPDCILYSKDGHNFPIHKEVFCQTKLMLSILESANSCCEKLEILIPSLQKEELECLIDFLYSGTIPSDDTTIKENLTTVFGFQEDMTFINNSRTFINNSRHEIDKELIAKTKIKQEAVENMDENFEGAMDFLASTEFNEGLDEVLSEASRSSKPLEIPQESEIQETIRKKPLENVTLVKLKPIEEITVEKPVENIRKRKSFSEEVLIENKTAKNSLTSKEFNDNPDEGFQSEASSCSKSLEKSQEIIKEAPIEYKAAKNFICGFCGNSFSQNLILELHVKGVHGELKTFKCEECPESFMLKESLSTHIKLVHQKSNPSKKAADSSTIS